MQTFIFEIGKSFPKNIRKDIDSLLSTLPYEPIWQTIDWQIMLYETGYVTRSVFLGVYDERKLLSYALFERRSIGLGQYGLFAIGGPVCTDTTSLDLLATAARELATKQGVVFVQIEPLTPCSLAGFTVGKYKDFIEKHTAVIDLTQGEEEILAHMKQKGRYNIRVAEKSGVTVSMVSTTSENIDTFYSLLCETTDRDGFHVNSKRYFEVFLKYLEQNQIGGLTFARRHPGEESAPLTRGDPAAAGGGLGDEVIAAGIFTFSGSTALYYYGASSSDNTKRKYMATYLLQWEMIREAKRRGCRVFDFLGIADPADPDSHLAGVTDFKLKLTDDVREWPRAQVMVVRSGWWWVLRTARKLRR